MSASKTIQHKGFIKEITEEGARVMFTSQSACADCHAKGVCSAADMKDKELLVKNTHENLHTGDSVNIIISLRQGSRAVMFGYVYPFLLFLISLLLLSAVGLSEVTAGLFSLSTLVPYYLAIYIFRDKIQNGFNFLIRKEG